ncbi:MAG: RHS repeat-associated core domain-containing protein, partial [Prosthecobacter sp.]|nr:RHS repeat-associated core domain-containing protein [Prosthecobacter sp.]
TQNPTQSTTHWFHYDSNGNAILLTDAKGKESALYRYDSFGRTIIAQGSAALLNRYRFSTKPVESVSGLAYYGYRYYSPNLGGWLFRDPLGKKGGLNLYLMVKNDPLNQVDKLGLFPWISDGVDWVVGQVEEQICDSIDSQAVCIVCCGMTMGVRAGLGMAETVTGVAAAGAGILAEGATLGTSTVAVVGGCLVAADGINYMSQADDHFEECRQNCYNNYPVP